MALFSPKSRLLEPAGYFVIIMSYMEEEDTGRPPVVTYAIVRGLETDGLRSHLPLYHETNGLDLARMVCVFVSLFSCLCRFQRIMVKT